MAAATAGRTSTASAAATATTSAATGRLYVTCSSGVDEVAGND